MDVVGLILDAVRREVTRQVEKEQRHARWATVETSSPLTVKFPGDTAAVPVGRTSGWSPTVGTQVVVLKVGRRGLIAIGEVA